jgi:2-dehydropantoate 2-reductase
LNGEIALLGRLWGVPTPVNDRLQQLVAEAARAGAPPGSTPIEELIAKLS